jgi:hypothetical protein
MSAIDERDCTLCVDMPPDEWCRACGRNEPRPPEPPPELSPLREAVRKAQGKHLTADEIRDSIGFLNEMAKQIKAAHRLSPTDQPEGDT